MFDIVSVGHFSIDSIILPERRIPFVVLGGSVTYISFIARRLNALVSVISKVGGDFPDAYLWWLRQEGIDLSGVIKVESAKSTRFELKYNGDLSSRNLRLLCKAPPITVSDLPNSLKAKAIHIAPLAGEISYDVVERLRKTADLLSLDPQGMVRDFNEDGTVANKAPIDKRILSLIDVYKSSLSEIKAVTCLSTLKSAVKEVHNYGVKIVFVTFGMNGAILSFEGNTYNIPAYTPEKVVDPTGAGDVFVGGFLAEYIHGEDILWCACVGSAAASIVVEALGPTFFAEKTKIYQRARLLYEKEIKQ